MDITKIQQQKRRKSRYNIFVDNKYTFAITESDLLEQKLVKGPISIVELEKLKGIATAGILYEYSLEHEARRPHSLLEHKKYLYRKATQLQLDKTNLKRIIDNVIKKLVKSGYQSDEVFTTWFIEQRTKVSKPKGKSKIVAELFQKGIKRDIINNAINSLIDKDLEIKNAQLLADKKRLTLQNSHKKLTEGEIKEKITRFLISRGYEYNVIKYLQLI